MKSINSFIVVITLAAMLGTSLPTSAAIVGTEQMVEQQSRAESLDRMDRFLASETVQAQLIGWGVAPEQVRERIDALSDLELQQLAAHIETDPAGGVLAVVGIVFVVLLILELTGVTNIFRSI